MTILSSSLARKAMPCLLILTGIILIQPVVLTAQEYTVEEYSAYQAISAETNATKKVGEIVQFFKTYPKSTLKPNVVAEFQGIITNLQGAKNWTQIITYGRQFLEVVPDDTYTLAALTAAYQATGNDKQFVAFGEEVYRKSPSGNLAYYIAKSYEKLGNPAKYAEWAERALTKLPDSYELALGLAKTYVNANRTAEAEKYAKQCISSLQAAKKPEQMSDGDWKAYTASAYATCYYILGNTAYNRQQYTPAITNLEKSLQYFPKNEMAFYYLGHSYWQSRRLDLAMKNFAKAYLMNGTTSNAARQYLENLYKSTHQQSLAGLDRVIAKAKEELK